MLDNYLPQVMLTWRLMDIELSISRYSRIVKVGPGADMSPDLIVLSPASAPFTSQVM